MLSVDIWEYSYHMIVWSSFFWQLWLIGCAGCTVLGHFWKTHLCENFGQQFFSMPRYVVNPSCLKSGKRIANIQYNLQNEANNFFTVKTTHFLLQLLRHDNVLELYLIFRSQSQSSDFFHFLSLFQLLFMTYQYTFFALSFYFAVFSLFFKFSLLPELFFGQSRRGKVIIKKLIIL